MLRWPLFFFRFHELIGTFLFLNILWVISMLHLILLQHRSAFSLPFSLNSRLILISFYLSKVVKFSFQNLLTLLMVKNKTKKQNTNKQKAHTQKKLECSWNIQSCKHLILCFLQITWCDEYSTKQKSSKTKVLSTVPTFRYPEGQIDISLQ